MLVIDTTGECIHSTSEMNAVEDRHDVRRWVIVRDAINELPTDDFDIPNRQSMLHV